MTTREAVECSGDAMTLRCPVESLPGHIQGAVSRWLADHDIDPDSVAVGQPIERDAMREILTWREDSDHGVLVRTRLPAVADGAVWPAPFPALLNAPVGLSVSLEVPPVGVEPTLHRF